MLDIPLVILAGGKSSRMGRDKALLPFGDEKTLTEYQLKRFLPHFRSIYVSCKSKDKFNFDANFIEDDKSFDLSAPFIALLTVLESLESEFVAFISVDTPFVDLEIFKSLYEQLEGDGVVAKSPNGVEPLCAIYSRGIIPILIDLIKQEKFRFAYLFEKIDLKEIEFVDEKRFINLNRPSEYNKYYIKDRDD